MRMQEGATCRPEFLHMRLWEAGTPRPELIEQRARSQQQQQSLHDLICDRSRMPDRPGEFGLRAPLARAQDRFRPARTDKLSLAANPNAEDPQRRAGSHETDLRVTYAVVCR